MDLWVVAAAAAGAGYIAKHWQNLSGEKDGESESSSANSVHRQSESRNLLQQIRDEACPFRRLSLRRLGGEVSTDRKENVSEGTLQEMEPLSGGLAAGDASISGTDAKILSNLGNGESCNVLMTSRPPGFQGNESFQETVGGISGKNEVLHNSGDILPEFETNILTRSWPLRSRRTRLCSEKPLNPFESCCTAQLYRGEQARKDEYVFSSLSSPMAITPAVRPLLVIDGNQNISRANSESFTSWDDGKKHRVKRKCAISLGENSSNSLLGTHSSQQLGSVAFPRKPLQRCGKEWLSSSSTRSSGGPFLSQGSPGGMLLFLMGITIGMMSGVIANKRESDKLNEMLKQTQNLVGDLHQELEMKDMSSVKELAREYTQSLEIIDCSSWNREAPVSSSERKLEESTKQDGKDPDVQKVESPDIMSKIEAELEAELERLELNMKASTLERISDFVELDSDFEADFIQGELKVNVVQPDCESDSDASGNPMNHIHTGNYAVLPRELSLRLHEVVESRLKARINELEASLRNSQRRLLSLEWNNSQRGPAYGEVRSSSTAGSPTFVSEISDMDWPLVINLSGEDLDSYNEAYDEIVRAVDTDEDTSVAVCDDDHMGKDISSSDKRLFESRSDVTDERWAGNLDHGKIGAWNEPVSRSRESNEAFDSDNEFGMFLIRQVVEKTRQGSSLVLNAQQMMHSVGD